MQPPVKTNDGIRAWLPVIGLALAAFVFNTSEFLPVGLLPEIAKSLHASVEHTGLVITGIRLGRISHVPADDGAHHKNRATSVTVDSYCLFCCKSLSGFMGRNF